MGSFGDAAVLIGGGAGGLIGVEVLVGGGVGLGMGVGGWAGGIGDGGVGDEWAFSLWSEGS